MSRLCEFPGLTPLGWVWDGSPNVSPIAKRSKKESSRGAKRYPTVRFCRPEQDAKAKTKQRAAPEIRG